MLSTFLRAGVAPFGVLVAEAVRGKSSPQVAAALGLGIGPSHSLGVAGPLQLAVGPVHPFGAGQGKPLAVFGLASVAASVTGEPLSFQVAGQVYTPGEACQVALAACKPF